MGIIRNFSTWVSNSFNSVMDGIASRMYTVQNSMYNSVDGGHHRASKTSEYLNIYDIDPNVYYDILNDYPFFNTLVKSYADSIYEIISKDDCHITMNDKKKESELNKMIDKYHLKDFILKNINLFIKRGTYVGFNNYKREAVNEIVDPFDNLFIERHGRFLSAEISESKVQMPFMDLFTYWYDRNVTDLFTVSEIEKINSRKIEQNFMDKEINKINDDINEIKHDETKNESVEEENIRKFKESVTVDTTIFKGKSMFEDYLRDLYKLFVREYIWDALSLSDYLKSNIITATVSAQKYDNRKVSNIINSIESLLNTDNVNIIMSYSDPLQLLNQINDKLLNKVRVLPQVSDYSSIDEMNLPDIRSQLEKLKQEIDEGKKDIENDLNIPEDIINGAGNRWEVSSKYVDYTDTLTRLLNTISESIKRFCVAYDYKKNGNYIDQELIEHKFDITKFISPYMNRSNITILNDKMKDVSGLLGTVGEVLEMKAINQDNFVKYLKKEMETADPELKDLIDFNKKKLGKSSDNDENTEGRSGRGFF